MTAGPSSSTSPASASELAVPLHWTPQQALAVFECLHALRQALWAVYGLQLQQAWRDQLTPDGPMPDVDPDPPF